MGHSDKVASTTTAVRLAHQTWLRLRSIVLVRTSNGFAQPSPPVATVQGFDCTRVFRVIPQARRFGMDAELCGSCAVGRLRIAGTIQNTASLEPGENRSSLKAARFAPLESSRRISVSFAVHTCRVVGEIAIARALINIAGRGSPLRESRNSSFRLLIAHATPVFGSQATPITTVSLRSHSVRIAPTLSTYISRLTLPGTPECLHSKIQALPLANGATETRTHPVRGNRNCRLPARLTFVISKPTTHIASCPSYAMS